MVTTLIRLMRLGNGARLQTPPPPPVIGQDYRWLAAGVGPKPEYRVALFNGDVPPGLAWAPDRQRLTGAPTAPGRYPLTFSITGRDRIPYRATYPLVVLPLPLRRVGDYTPGAVGGAAAGAVTIVGGTPDYRLIAITGTPPPGVTFSMMDGVITRGGAFSASGAWAYQFVIEDAAGRRVAFPMQTVVAITLVAVPYTTLAGVPYTTLAGVPYTTLPQVLS